MRYYPRRSRGQALAARIHDASRRSATAERCLSLRFAVCAPGQQRIAPTRSTAKSVHTVLVAHQHTMSGRVCMQDVTPAPGRCSTTTGVAASLYASGGVDLTASRISWLTWANAQRSDARPHRQRPGLRGRQLRMGYPVDPDGYSKERLDKLQQRTPAVGGGMPDCRHLARKVRWKVRSTGRTHQAFDHFLKRGGADAPSNSAVADDRRRQSKGTNGSSTAAQRHRRTGIQDLSRMNS